MYESSQTHPTISSIPPQIAERSDAPNHAGESPAEPGLGRLTKYVEKRRRNFALQAHAARLLPRQRVAHCLWSLAYNAESVEVLKREDRARLGGLQVCGSVWHCPVCSARISETRRGELNKALVWARGGVIEDEDAPRIIPVMMTLTARHKRGDSLRAQLDGMKEAKRRLRQSHSWRSLRSVIEGTITATEVTHGSNGWHSHFHELLFLVADDEKTALKLVEGLRAEWLRSLTKVGMSAGKAGFDAQGAAKAGDYITKWGAAEELTLLESKTGAGRTPFQLLEASKDGDKQAGALFTEYALAFKGRRQLVWSNGFKKRVGVDEVEDEDAAEEAKEELVDEVIAVIDAGTWAALRRRRLDRAALLRAAEVDGFEGVARVIEECLSNPPPS